MRQFLTYPAASPACSRISPDAFLHLPDKRRVEKSTDLSTQSEHIPIQYPMAPSSGIPGSLSVVSRNARLTRMVNMDTTAQTITYFTSLVAFSMDGAVKDSGSIR